MSANEASPTNLSENEISQHEQDLQIILQEIQKCHSQICSILSEEEEFVCAQWDLLPLEKQMMQLKTLVNLKIDSVKLHSSKIDSNELTHIVTQNTSSKENEDIRKVVQQTIEIPRVISLEEIAGLWEVKKIMRSFTILPRSQPQLYVNHKVCKSVLLFGPPGTGKTRLVHALASEAKAVLHCISSSNILSSYVGESERLKTELMCQLSRVEENPNAMLICATNCPWDLDTAFLRRFHKRLYIPLPGASERHLLLKLFTQNTPLEMLSSSWQLVVEKTAGFSGCDIYNLVQEALSIPILELQDTKVWRHCSDGFYEPATSECIKDSVCPIIFRDIKDLPPCSVRARPSNAEDLFMTVHGMTPTVSESDIKKFNEFNAK